MARVFPGKPARVLARALLAADEHAFAGYARWQINERWDVFAGQESVKPYRAEERFFARILALPWPRAFAASLAFRLYLARRDVFVREAAWSVFHWRRLLAKGELKLVIYYMTKSGGTAAGFARALRAGRQAARAMWTRTRDPQVRGANELMLDADEARLREWRRWLKRAARQPLLAGQATPVCGAWQLQFMVHNFSPAVQRVVVEQQAADGTWAEPDLCSCPWASELARALWAPASGLAYRRTIQFLEFRGIPRSTASLSVFLIKNSMVSYDFELSCLY
jgi:hypothetical protein